ncbi:peptide deformylase [Clostridium thermosuccinogenes]|jgi:peptide deformylase|uniref:Peptide deformylase n=1 Tax=Clostridium thermosuccinogenes TaxID=84032 RepID=A0A2K2F3U6_9CLOT|nr:peptide deformylase [Pseudoclostridium thermosuccinogenes]AUS95847.1 peptide deformylase [Pseudoclostridium thermosuccinogenes]PNT93436.1 peptide deformylase [Pseudoclostridium thermosuccinogenes]PNT98328.1 peptide deformylase [Pseudoclostridium thermosuccinogenes]PNU00429.1 peptide deformylase [Pseudoclostridium thermosuccinogenes]
MAIRNIRLEGEEVLRKVSREVDVIDEKILTLLKDMAETMYKADGVGLAAPQVGILKRVVVIDVGDGLLELINPKIVEQEGEQIEVEGCLSIPNLVGEVKRPARVVVEALDPRGEKVVINADGLLAIALCHEIDHLDGILFKDKAIRLIDKNDYK